MLRGNRFRLVTLGRLTLICATGEEDVALAKRRLKLAVLAVLAMARRPIARDTLLEMFWGEQDEERARHSLSNALSSLRRALGQGSITARDADVALAHDLPLDVDALLFSEAAESGDTARAVELYGGSFLEGVHVDESPAFDQWAFRERRRFEALFIKACSQQCVSLARSRRWPECRTVAARWIDVEPLSPDAALFLLNAIKAPGTRVALGQALDEFERIRTRLLREFDLAPELNVRELAERIREQMAASPPEPTLEAQPQSAAATPASPPALDGALAPAVGTGLPATATSPPPVRRTVRLSTVWRVAGLATAAAALVIAVVSHRENTSDGSVAVGSRKPVIAVFTVDVRTTDSAVAWLADGLPAMIDGKLARVNGIDVVSPTRVRAVLLRNLLTRQKPLVDSAARDLARRVGATLLARGTLARDGGKLVFDLTVHDVVSGRLLQNPVLSHTDALALADEAAARIVSASNVRPQGPQLATLETSSLEAYQLYMRALEAGQAGRLSELQQNLDAAIQLDSGFIAVVRARMGIAMGSNDTTTVRRLRQTMQRYMYRATEYDRLDQEAGDAFYAGDRERSEALARGLVRRYPRDPRAYQVLQGILGSHGRFDEAEQVATAGLALDSLAMESGTGPCAPCVGFSNIVGLHWVRADWRGAAQWSRRWIRAQPDAPAAWASLAWTFSYMQRPDSALPLMQRAVSLSGGDLWAISQFARMLLVARKFETADSVITSVEGSSSPGRREVAVDLRSILDRERGRFRAADRIIAQLLALQPSSTGFFQLVQADNRRQIGDYAGAARTYEALAHGPREAPSKLPLPAPAARAFCWHHALGADAYAFTGDTVTLRAKADTLEQSCAASYYARDWRLHHHVRGLVALQGRRYADAERELKQAIWTPAEGWPRTTVELARAQAGLGHWADAIATLRTGYATRLDAMGRYVSVSELDYWMARTFAQAGERDSARVYAESARRAWRDSDPEIKKLLALLP
jgi:DNA-binding SARP family transcriptional activator/TolB-like protein